MARKKLRPENSPKVFAYDIQIIGDVPQVVFDLAKAQQQLWNAMATRHQVLADTSKEMDKDAKAAAYAEFWQWAYDQTRQMVDDWPCWACWQIYDAFKVAQAGWAKAISRGYKLGHPLYRGIPRTQEGLKRIKLEHRTDSGGVEMAWLYRDGDKKHTHLRREAGLTRGYFSINGERVPFEVVMHRPIPNECILKRIALAGQYEPAFKEWRWKIIFLVEHPPQVKPHGDVVAALDLGWRRREDGIRLGVLWANGKPQELFLPFNLANRSERKQIERYPDTEVTRDIRQVWEMKSLQDGLLEEFKVKVREMSRNDWPEEARLMMSGITKMRAGGLRRLRRLLWDAGIKLAGFEDWMTRHIELSKRRRQAEIRIGLTKQAAYRNIAAWLSRHCKALVWEGDLGLKEMAEAEFGEGEEALKNAQKHRQFVGIYNLRMAIKHAMGDRMIDEKAAYSTQTCVICGGHIEPGPSLVLACVHGHRQDQDINAARVLFERLPEELRAASTGTLAADLSQVSRYVRPLSL